MDVRAAAADWRAAARWEVAADVECVAWDPQACCGVLRLMRLIAGIAVAGNCGALRPVGSSLLRCIAGLLRSDAEWAWDPGPVAG